MEDSSMDEIKLGAVESRFADIVWQNEPLPSGELVKLCEKELSWKKPTTYTVLRKLCERGIFQNKDGIVSSLLSRQEFHGIQSERFVEETFDGSLPAFIAAFAKRKALSPEEIAEIRRMIDSYGEG
jgi:Predicted transcriptional regulator